MNHLIGLGCIDRSQPQLTLRAVGTAARALVRTWAIVHLLRVSQAEAQVFAPMAGPVIALRLRAARPRCPFQLYPVVFYH